MPSMQNGPNPGKPSHPSQYNQAYPAMSAPANAAPSTSSPFSRPLPPTQTQDESKSSSLTPVDSKFSQVQSHSIGSEPPYFLGMSSAYSESNARASAAPHSSYNLGIASTQTPQYTYSMASAADQHASSAHLGSRPGDMHSSMNVQTGGMMIESHDIDMNTLQQQESFPFFNGEILPWLEYLPPDVLSFFGETQNFPMMSPDDTTPRPPQ